LPLRIVLGRAREPAGGRQKHLIGSTIQNQLAPPGPLAMPFKGRIEAEIRERMVNLLG